LDVFTTPNPDRYLLAAYVKCVAEEVITIHPCWGRGDPSNPGDSWLVVSMAYVNQTLIWEICYDTAATSCDDFNVVTYSQLWVVPNCHRSSTWTPCQNNSRR